MKAIPVNRCTECMDDPGGDCEFTVWGEDRRRIPGPNCPLPDVPEPTGEAWNRKYYDPPEASRFIDALRILGESK